MQIHMYTKKKKKGEAVKMSFITNPNLSHPRSGTSSRVPRIEPLREHWHHGREGVFVYILDEGDETRPTEYYRE